MGRRYDLKRMTVKHRGPLVKPTAKVQKTIRLDLDVLSWLVEEAHRRGLPYQTGTSASPGDRGSDQANRLGVAGSGSTANRSRHSSRCSLRRLSRPQASWSAALTAGSRGFS